MKQSPSPQLVKPAASKLMGFAEAIKEILNGKKVTRDDWLGNDDYVFMHGEWLAIHHPGETKDTWHVWSIREIDLTATDYRTL